MSSHTRTVCPSYPAALWKDAIFSGANTAAVAVCAFVFGPFGPSGQPDPTIIHTVPKPDFFFLWIYAALAYLPPSMETPAHSDRANRSASRISCLPFYAAEGEKSWHRRPVAVLVLCTVAIRWGVLTHLATFTPWSPHMDAWSGDPVPPRYLRDATPLVRQGAVVFQSKQCRNCHRCRRKSEASVALRWI